MCRSETMKILRISSGFSTTFIVVLILASRPLNVWAYKVLMLPLAGKSHVMSMAAIAEGLASRGHEVTLYIGKNFPLKFPELRSRAEVSIIRYKDSTDGEQMDFDAVEENITKSAVECGSGRRQRFTTVRVQL